MNLNLMNMKSPVLYLGSLFFAVFVACNPIQELKRSVNPISELKAIPKDAFVYALPRTVISVDIEYVKIVGKRGPFYNLRFKYLGIKEGLEEDFTSWSLNNIQISSFQEIDPEEYYVVSGNVYSNFLFLSKRGMVLTTESGMFGAGIDKLDPFVEDEVFFADLSVKRKVEVFTDTASKMVFVDTGFVRVPYLDMKSRFKTLDEKAEEAANFIIKIRKRRFKLLSGQYDVFPEGIALEYAVKELTKLENEYLALFVGKTVRYKYSRSFEVIPESGPEEQTYPFFSFSHTDGLMPEGIPNGKQVTLNINSLGTTRLLKQYAFKSDTLSSGGLIYRVPEVTRVEVLEGERVLCSEKLLIYQLGKLLRLPENFPSQEIK